MTKFPEAPESPADEAPVVVPIGDSLDLHPFAPRDIPSVVDEYLREAHRRGFREVRIIHGRGQGVQRAVVRRVLRGHSLVVSFADAAPPAGGWGATMVVLGGEILDRSLDPSPGGGGQR